MLMEEPRMRQVVERAQEKGQIENVELSGLVADLDLSDEDVAQLRAELDELGVEIVSGSGDRPARARAGRGDRGAVVRAEHR